MYIFNTLKNILQFWTLEMPLSFLFPAVFVIAAVLHGFLLWSVENRFKWIIPILSAGILVICEVSIWLIHSYAALIIIVAMHVFEAALLGTLVSTLFYQFLKKVRS